MKIVGAGLVSVDNIFVVKKKPVSGLVQSDSREFPENNPPTRYIGSHGGGSASNTLCTLSKLGFETSIVGAIGKDTGADLVCDEFEAFGVSTRLLVKKDAETRQFTHLIYPDTHVFNSQCPICRKKFSHAPFLDERDVFAKNDVLKEIFDADTLHVDRANRFTLKLVDSAYRERKIVSFDFGNQASLGNFELASEIIKRTTILKTSQGASRTFFSRIGKQSFHELNPNMLICVTTLGDQGARITYKSPEGLKSMSLQPYHPKPIVDRGGAGDAFHAGLLYGLKDSISHDMNAVESASVLHYALEFAQGLGALACTEYGARGYFLGKLKEGNFESSVLSDFDLLSQDKFVGSPQDPDALFAKERSKLLSAQICGVCHRPFLGSEPITRYEERIDSAAWAMSTSFLSGLASAKSFTENPGERVYFIGSGGSFAVAVFGALFLNQFSNSLGIAVTPYDYVSMSRDNSSAILVSFGGENRDILSSLDKAVDLHSREIHVITGKNDSTLARMAKGIGAHIHHVSQASDGGFVSSAGMLACLSMLLGVLEKSFDLASLDSQQFFSLQGLTGTFQQAKNQEASDFQQFADLFDREKAIHLVILGSGWSWPAVMDFEGKMSEGAVCTSEISELKNFTHGRYLNAYRNKASRFFIIFGLPSDWKLIRFLREKLAKDFSVMSVTSALDPPLGALELMIKGLYLSSEVSKKMGLDIARVVRFPKESRGLFSWGPIYSPTSKMDQFVRPNPKQEIDSKHQTKLA